MQGLDSHPLLAAALQELCRGYGTPVPEMAAVLPPSDIHVGELWSLPPNKVDWQGREAGQP
jgi:hypothetical protein